MHANVGAPWGIMVESGARYRTSADTLQVVLGPRWRGPRGRHSSQGELFIFNLEESVRMAEAPTKKQCVSV